MPDDDSYDYIYKVVLCGQWSVGKTNLLTKFTKDQFDHDSKSTIGVEFSCTTTEIEGMLIKAQIWDTCGQDKYLAIIPAYYRRAAGVLIVFDITKRRSFEDIPRWMTRAHDYADPSAVITIVGNKTDLEHLRTVSSAEAEAYAEEHNCLYIETSARDGTNVNRAFDMLLEKIFRWKLPEFTASVRYPEKRENPVEPKQTSYCCS